MKAYKTIFIGGKQLRLHRYLMEQKLGRKLDFNEIVHHKDGNIFNNDLENLEVISRAEHLHKEHPEINKKAIESKTKHNIDLDKLKNLFIEKRYSIEKISKLLKIPFGTLAYHIRKNRLKRQKVFCSCGSIAKYPTKKLCSKCYLRKYYKDGL